MKKLLYPDLILLPFEASGPSICSLLLRLLSVCQPLGPQKAGQDCETFEGSTVKRPREQILEPDSLGLNSGSAMD